MASHESGYHEFFGRGQGSASADRRARDDSEAEWNGAGIPSAPELGLPPAQAVWTLIVISPLPSLNGVRRTTRHLVHRDPPAPPQLASKRGGSAGFRTTMSGRRCTARCLAIRVMVTPKRSIGEPGWRPSPLPDRLRARVRPIPCPLGPPSLDFLGLVRGRVQLDEAIDGRGQAVPIGPDCGLPGAGGFPRLLSASEYPRSTMARIAGRTDREARFLSPETPMPGTTTATTSPRTGSGDAPNTPPMPPIPRRPLGRTGHEVTQFALGGEGVLRTHGRMSEAVAVIHRALDLGVNYCDTAPAYAGSLDYYGAALGERRREVFLASKTHDRTRDGSLRLLDESLKRLRTDHLDLWQLHDLRTPGDLARSSAPAGPWRRWSRRDRRAACGSSA